MNITPDPASIEILIVDDNPTNLGLLDAILTEAGWRVRIAPNGLTALSSAALKAPHLVLLDINMPDLDGWEVCRRMKADADMREVPIIFLSALTETEDKLKGFEAGGVDYITKPFSASEVLARVKVHIHLSVTKAMLTDQRGELMREVELRRHAEEELRRANDVLEEKIRERTADLTRANLALTTSEQRYMDLYDHSPDMYVSVNAETARIEMCNQTLADKLRYTKAEIVGKPIFDLYHPECMDEVKKAFQSFVTTGEVHNAELALKKRDGAKVDVNLNVTSVRDACGKVKYSRSCWIDISERKRIERALAAAREQAERANQAKSEFLAMMSHEIRTPMNAILGNIELLQEPDITDNERRAYLAVQQQAGESLLTLIDDILELSRLEAGGAEQVSLCSFNLHQLLHSVASLLDRLADSKGTAIQVEMEENLSHTWIGDERRIRQILLNLLGNAVKFTDEGQVRLKARSAPEGEGVAITVADTGIGIPEPQQQRIFEHFYQVDSTSTRPYGGSGLGLAIVHKLIRLLRGSITMESALGVGTCFDMVLPLREDVADGSKQVAPVEAPSVSQPSKEPELRVLLAEDSLDNALLIQSFMKRTPHHLTVVVNGALALEKVQSDAFDLVLMDMQMPIMDGYEATRLIRRWEVEHGRTPLPVLALTAHALHGDRDKSLEAGCDRHLTKPIKKRLLLKVLSEYANGATSQKIV
ncbi:MAG: response regulator [Magnetococcales bacterium]|nr:response regulator [Magnetococcales bacterium]